MRATQLEQIPFISLDDLEGFRSAFHEYGFAVMKDYVPKKEGNSLRTAAYSFFRSSLAWKMKFSSGDTYGPPGFSQIGQESVLRSIDGGGDSDFTPDPVESFVYHGENDGANVPEVLREPLRAYWKQMNSILDRIMRATAVSQGLPRDFFVAAYNGRNCSLRLAYYPAGGHVKYGAHTDYTGFTLLSAERSGLQVLHEEGAGAGWVDVATMPTDLIVNAGDLIPVWTNGRFKSATHRVVSTEETRKHDRLSLVFFTGPADDTLVTPIVQEGETAKYEPVLSGEHLASKLSSTNKNATANDGVAKN